MKHDTDLIPLRIRRNRYALLGNTLVPFILLVILLTGHRTLGGIFSIFSMQALQAGRCFSRL